MLALTLKHPWPFAIVHLGKRIENRTWKPPRSAIGQRIAIHGGKAPTAYNALNQVRTQAMELIERFGVPVGFNNDIKLRDAILPGVVAVATLTGYVEASDDPWFDGSGFGWILADVTELTDRVLCSGAQGLWTVPEWVEHDVYHQLEAGDCMLR